jgi:hypothetical protein
MAEGGELINRAGARGALNLPSYPEDCGCVNGNDDTRINRFVDGQLSHIKVGINHEAKSPLDP